MSQDLLDGPTLTSQDRFDEPTLTSQVQDFPCVYDVILISSEAPFESVIILPQSTKIRSQP